MLLRTLPAPAMPEVKAPSAPTQCVEGRLLVLGEAPLPANRPRAISRKEMQSNERLTLYACEIRLARRISSGSMSVSVSVCKQQVINALQYQVNKIFIRKWAVRVCMVFYKSIFIARKLLFTSTVRCRHLQCWMEAIPATCAAFKNPVGSVDYVCLKAIILSNLNQVNLLLCGSVQAELQDMLYEEKFDSDPVC